MSNIVFTIALSMAIIGGVLVAIYMDKKNIHSKFF